MYERLTINQTIIINIHQVGGFNLSEKYYVVRLGRIIPYITEKNVWNHQPGLYVDIT